MMSDIKANKHITVDAELHTEHSFNGMICFLQISTQVRDYLIDPFVPDVRDCIRKYLKPIFEDESILKLFHNPTNDVKLLQIEFQIFTFPIIDTQAVYSYLPYGMKKN